MMARDCQRLVRGWLAASEARSHMRRRLTVAANALSLAIERDAMETWKNWHLTVGVDMEQ